ncbi:hypothetical protein [Hyphomicrobium sp. CS1GBMeth3]|uniref:hypothetical protein n=1 Tax=Hyphomicrobium sp. CS1GBMeth3 TaxID=1892845 RepID=UPI000A86254F|nr:hypothetical protein [Hyphomicrobium sp. CS1GBMeth3]
MTMETIARDRVLAGGTLASISAKKLLDLYVTTSEQHFGSEWGARMNMDREWAQLWRDGRLVECDGAVCFAIGGDAKEASESKNPGPA